MSANSMELISLNKADLPDKCQNEFNYSTLDEHEDAKFICQKDGSKTEDDDTLTDIQGFMILFRTYIGIAFLGIPYTVKLLGLWSGSAGLFLGGVLNEIGTLVLTGNSQELTERTGERFSDIGALAERSMELGPQCLQCYAGKIRWSVNCCVLLTCGLLMPDLISIMNLLAQDSLQQYIHVNDTLSIIGISVLLLPVYLTRRMKLLSYLATVGNVVITGIILISFQYICQDLPDISTRPAGKHVDYLTFTSFANDVMFSFGGIVTVLPIRNRMKCTKHFDGWNGLLGLVFIVLVCFHVGFGFFGYLKFGETTKVNFILNLPNDNSIYKSLKVLCFLSSYCTMGIFVFVPVEIIWAELKDRFTMEIVRNYGEYLCRVFLLLFSCTFTILVPEFELLMSLTGCVGAYFISIIVPFMILILVIYSEEESTIFTDKVKRKVKLLCSVLMLILGIYSMISGIGVAIYTALYHIVL